MQTFIIFFIYNLFIYDFNFVFLNIIGNENLVECGINQKAAEDDMNDILTGKYLCIYCLYIKYI